MARTPLARYAVYLDRDHGWIKSICDDEYINMPYTMPNLKLEPKCKYCGNTDTSFDVCHEGCDFVDRLDRAVNIFLLVVLLGMIGLIFGIGFMVGSST